jgi:hypothetical protein
MVSAQTLALLEEHPATPFDFHRGMQPPEAEGDQ